MGVKDIVIVRADYSDKQHQQDIPMLLGRYALDPMGGGQALAENVKQNLVQALAELPQAFSILAYQNNNAVGLVNCFEGFSTFLCRPLVNIHDVVVLDTHRGLGISLMMLNEVEQIAKEKGCCKLTLEVLSNNKAAKSAYEKFGFAGYELDPEAGTALFWQKPLPIRYS